MSLLVCIFLLLNEERIDSVSIGIPYTQTHIRDFRDQPQIFIVIKTSVKYRNPWHKNLEVLRQRGRESRGREKGGEEGRRVRKRKHFWTEKKQ